ncbi:hypothetical protein BUALT_Bualt03G0106600 [Buddleja alternifolia]|uniref:Mitochondrial import inner membrane translocase subunit TIM50 n=1 Tax=Buddleja alternifolia TaxID=168488 RepID=A0AAV6XWZ8_9LAMI|nr:hypothetical protein BUALT_Bualt03G0106600 [Buddleja alternifolia]
MSALIRSGSRHFSTISRSSRRYSSSVTSEPSKETLISSSILSDQPPPPPSGQPPVSEAEKNSWSFFKYGLIAALTGGIAIAGYATYAYSLDEIDQKTKGLRASAYYTIGDDASSFDKFQAYLRAAAMTVPAKLVEVYIDLRRLTEKQVRYVDPVAERLDPKHYIRYRLSRAATRYINGKHYRDLSMLNRDPAKVLYISGHAVESSLQPENSVPIKIWQGETDDTALVDLIPFLECRDIAKEFIERSKEHQKMQEHKQHGRLWRH